MEGGCWEYAIEEFKQAIRQRSGDRRNVRAYGMHFRDEYFPHREMGISYFYMGRLEEALQELELSMSHTPSARAKYYLNKTRRSYLLASGEDTRLPEIHIEFPEIHEYITNQTSFQIRGEVRDDRYVSAITVGDTPVFIEMAEPSIPFTFPVTLKEGWNTIEVVAADLIEREERRQIRVYLDSQGPLVIFKENREVQGEGEDMITVTALIYDLSGIVSFRLDQKEVPRLGMDQLCLIEEKIPWAFHDKRIPFEAEDRAGNITKGEFSLSHEKGTPHLLSRIAFLEKEGGVSFFTFTPLAQNPQRGDISFDMVYPPLNELTTYYQEIFLEGEIEAKNGINWIELNGKRLPGLNEIRSYESRNRQRLIQTLKGQEQNPERYVHLFNTILQGYTTHYLNHKICLIKDFTTLDISVEDLLGNRDSKEFRIRKILREDIFQSEQRMLLAILPFETDMDTPYDKERSDFIHKTLYETFIQQGRFNIVEEAAMPWHIVKKGKRIFDEDTVRQIGEITSAEGIIYGSIQKWLDGIEVNATFRDAENGEVLVFHDVFSPQDTARDLNTIISGLAIKFRDSFPMCTGTIINRDGQIIYVNMGSKDGLFPGMKCNIFIDDKELISKAVIKKVGEGVSEATLYKKTEEIEIKEGYRVRTR